MIHKIITICLALCALVSSCAFAAEKSAAKRLPAWYANAKVGEWTLLDETNPDPAQTAFGGAVINTVGVYIGATFVPGTFYIQLGGGHAAGNDNRVYAWGPFEAEKPQWHTLSSFVSLAEEVFSGPG